jgi:hypothetical protein
MRAARYAKRPRSLRVNQDFEFSEFVGRNADLGAHLCRTRLPAGESSREYGSDGGTAEARITRWVQILKL